MEVQDKNMPRQHSALRIGLIITTIVVFIVMIALNSLAGAGIGIFKNSTGDISDVFELEITPAGWTFSIWGFIYAWQGIWLVYGLSTICRKVNNGTYIYLLPVMCPWIYVIYIINNLFNIGWLVAWDHEEIIASLVLIAMIPITLFIILFISFRELYRSLGMLIKQGAAKEIWLIRFTVQNGIAFYAAWVTVATLLNVAMVIIYKGGVANDIGCTISLSILSALLVTWFILDNFVLDKYVRYTFSPYVTLTIALSGALYKNLTKFSFDMGKRNTYFLLVLLVVAALFLLLKVIIILYRHFRKPICPKDDSYEPTI